MIDLKEAFLITKTKFRVRKVKNILISIAISFGLVIMLFMMIVTSGVIYNGKQLFRDEMRGRYFATEILDSNKDTSKLTEEYKYYFDKKYGIKSVGYERIIYPENIQGIIPKEKEFCPDYKKDTVDIKKEEIGDKAEFVGSVLNSDCPIVYKYLPDFTNDKVSYNSLILKSSSEKYIGNYLGKKYSFKDEYNGKIPVIISRSFLFKIEDEKNKLNFYKKLSAKGIYSLHKDVEKQYLGKTFKLDQFTSMPEKNGTIRAERDLLNNEYVVVGFYVPMFSLDVIFGSMNNEELIIFPNWAVERDGELKEMFSVKYSGLEGIVEFKTKESRDKFVQKDTVDRRTSKGIYDSFDSILKNSRKFGLYFGGFLLVVSSLLVFFTINKLVADSRREIGVFRAVGAQKKDIKILFSMYVWMLVSLGFVVALVISYALVMILSLKWGDWFFYNVAVVGNAPELDKPSFMFLGFPVFNLILIYLITVLSGFLAAMIPIIRASRLDVIKALQEN